MSILEGSVGRASDVEQKGTMPTTPKTVDRTPRVLTVLIYVAAAVLAVAILALAFHKVMICNGPAT